jgi:peptide/nickel transport system substrate-binding protein
LEKESPDSYDTITSRNMAALRLTELIFESLLCETKWGFEGRLADKWELSSDSLEITFYLKEQVNWCEVASDGVTMTARSFTADDVLYTYRLIKNQKTDTDPYNRELLRDVEEPETLSPNTIRFRFKKKQMRPEESFTFKIVPRYKIPGDFITRADAFTTSPVGTGYYVLFKDFGSEKILKVNEAHHDERANIDKIEMDYYADESILSDAALLTKEISAVIEARIKDIAKFQSSGQYEIRRYAPLSFDYIGYNLKDPLFSDKRVRQALTHAIDRERILEVQFLDKGKVISGPYPPGSPLNNPDVGWLPYDTVMAKRLLKEAGFNEIDGEWVKGGSKLAFKLTVAAEQNEPAWSTAQHIMDYWKNIGVQVDLKKVTWPSWWKTVYEDRDFQATYGRWRCDRASNICPLYTKGDEKNYISYYDPTVDSLIHLLDDIEVPEERRVINWQLHEILARDCPYTFLWTLYRHAAVSKKVKNSDMIHNFNFFNYIKEWWIPEEWQK